LDLGEGRVEPKIVQGGRGDINCGADAEKDE